MSLLLLFRPKSGIGGEPEPEPPPVIVSAGGGVKRRKKRYMSVAEFESRDTLEKFLKEQINRKLPQELPDPLREKRAQEDAKRLKAQQKREATMRAKAEAQEKKRKSVERHNRAVIALLMLALETDDDS